MNDIKQIILPESPEAASVQTVTGWVSRTGRYWGNDERMARYDGSTHRKCECGEIIKQRSYCKTCNEKRELDKFLAMEKKPWDGTAMLYSLLNDEYYNSPELAFDYAEENGLTNEDLQLIICEPNYAKEIDSSYWSDDLPEDGENDVLETAIKELNQAIKGEILSWSAGDFALDLTDLHTEG
jgi:hypothetical protein